MGEPKRRLLNPLGRETTPAGRALALGIYGFFCLFPFFLGSLSALRPGYRPVALVLPLVPLLLPFALYLWTVRKPEPSLIRDPRVWALTVSGLVGQVLYFLLEGTWTIFLLMPFGAAVGWVALLGLKRQEAARVKAERRGWRLVPGEEKELGQVLVADMAPRERLRHYLVLASMGAVAFVCGAACGYFDSEIRALSRADRTAFLIYTGIWALLVLDLVGFAAYLSVLLRRQVLSNKRSQFELNAARQMQMSLMPERAPEVPGLDIAGITAPALEVGGDLFHYFEPPGIDCGVGIALADVSGKGMKAAVAAVLVSGMLRAERDRGDAPEEILTAINGALVAGVGVSGFVAMQVVVVDGNTRRARYSNAGQVHPLLLRRNAAEALIQGGLPLGIDGAPDYQSITLDLELGDVLLLMSDGILEAMNDKRVMLGFEGVERIAKGLDASKSASALRDEVLGAAQAFQGKAPQADDMTLVVVKVL